MRLRQVISGIAVAGGLAMASGQASAIGIVNVSTTPGTQFNIAGAVSNFTTGGADMGGMLVTALFAGGGSQTIAWNAGLGLPGSYGAGWQLTHDASTTFGNPWHLAVASGTSLAGLVINAVPGNTVFDIDPEIEVTPGSADGIVFSSAASNANVNVDALYQNVVSLNGTIHLSAGGNPDLYGTLALDFTSTVGGATGFLSNTVLSFVADTDNATANSTITPVPAPGAVLIFGLGLVGLRLVRRRVGA